MNWSNLPKTDKKHLRQNKIFTKYQFEKQVIFQKAEYDKLHKDLSNFVCWDCISIARKLGMWGDA